MEGDNIEVVEILLDNNHYGINADVVKEIIPYQQVTLVPNAHPSVEGVFMPRNQMITAIDLKNCLQLGTCGNSGLFVVTQLEGVEAAFHIDSVVGIHKIEEENVMEVGFSKQDSIYVTGALKYEERLIILLNTAKIVQDINPDIVIES